MAAKSQHGQDNSVIERRLRPIYDWLELGNNKKALQESEKVLKKWPKVMCARALRCLAWLKLGRESEAKTHLETLVQETPTEDATLQVITMCYRELHQLDKVCILYERAVKAEPSNEELHTHLFMSYVRVGALEKQHHAAMQLYKLKPKNPYYFWAVMSVLLQATKGSGSTDPTKRQVLISLCGRMVERVGGGDSNTNNGGMIGANWGEQELRLYLRVLALQGRHKEALKLLDSPHCKVTLMPGEAQQTTLPLLVLTENWTLLNVTVKTLIEANPDRWDLYKYYLDSAFHLMEGTNNKEKDNVDGVVTETDDTPVKCKEFLMEMMKMGGPKIRGPYLARLELFKRLREHNKDPESLLGSARDLLVGYLSQFGSKACSVGDLRMFLCLQPPQDRAALAQAFRETAGVTDKDDIPLLSEDAMQRHISALQLCRMCGSPPPVDELLHALRPPRAPAPAVAQRAPTDPYCLLLVHHLMHSALQQKHSAPLVKALDVLHDAIQRSPSNFHCKILAIKIYHLLGCGMGAQQVYSSLEVRHVQLDSLGHVHTSLLGATGLLAVARDHYDYALKFFSHSYKDSVDHLTLSYKFGSFNKLEELMEWRERLHNSLHHALFSLERHTLDLHLYTLGHNNTMPPPITPYCPPEWDTLRDNRDVGVQVDWEPPSNSEGEAEKDFQRELWYCKVKGTMLKCVGARGETLVNDIETLQGVANKAGSYVEETVNQPRLSRINTLLPLVPLYVKVLTCVVKTEAGENGEKEMEECCRLMGDEQNRVLELLKQEQNHDTLWTYRNTMDAVVSYVEVVSVVCVTCGLCVDIISKGKSKTKWRPPSTLMTLLQSLLNALPTWPSPTPSIEHGMDTLSLTSGDFPRHNTWDEMAAHHSKAVEILQQIVKDKIKYMTAITPHH